MYFKYILLNLIKIIPVCFLSEIYKSDTPSFFCFVVR